MIFTVTTSAHFYSNEERRTELEKIGFTFKPSNYKNFTIVGEPTIEIKDLTELIQFSNKWGEIIVGDETIEIYNDYRE
jgi:hypothetical protein